MGDLTPHQARLVGLDNSHHRYMAHVHDGYTHEKWDYVTGSDWENHQRPDGAVAIYYRSLTTFAFWGRLKPQTGGHRKSSRRLQRVLKESDAQIGDVVLVYPSSAGKPVAAEVYLQNAYLGMHDDVVDKNRRMTENPSPNVEEGVSKGIREIDNLDTDHLSHLLLLEQDPLELSEKCLHPWGRECRLCGGLTNAQHGRNWKMCRPCRDAFGWEDYWEILIGPGLGGAIHEVREKRL